MDIIKAVEDAFRAVRDDRFYRELISSSVMFVVAIRLFLEIKGQRLLCK